MFRFLLQIMVVNFLQGHLLGTFTLDVAQIDSRTECGESLVGWVIVSEQPHQTCIVKCQMLKCKAQSTWTSESHRCVD